MADTIKIPGVGPTKKIYAYSGIAVLGGILVYAYWRRANTTPVAPTAAPDAGLTDPYSQASDASGYNMIYPPVTGSDFSRYGYDIYGNPLPAPTGATGTGGAFTTNQDWATAAVNLAEQGGATREAATLAISHVLGGLRVTTAQQSMFLDAVGVLGSPPQGYPTPIKLVDTPGQPSPAPSPSGASLAAPRGLHTVSVGTGSVSLDWEPVPGAVGYTVFAVKDAPGGGAPAAHRQATVNFSLYTVKGLTRHTRYRFEVAPMGKDQKLGKKATVYATTKK